VSRTALAVGRVQPMVGESEDGVTKLGTLRALAMATYLGTLLGCGGSGGGVVGETLTPGSVDLDVDPLVLRLSTEVVEMSFDPQDCEVLEGAVGGVGLRRLLRFDTRVRNLGALPLVIGDPAHPTPPIPADAFEFDPCHGHYHMRGFARYELRHTDGTLAAIGHKQSFCLIDTVPVVLGMPSLGFDCADQGLSPGWADTYDRGVPGQWIDVSGVAGGDYLLVVTVNPDGVVFEADDRRPDQVSVPLHVPDPSTSVAQLDDHADTPSGATKMPVPAGFQAQIRPADDPDWFRIHVEEGRTYVLRTELLTLGDSRLRVFLSDGVTPLGENDDVVPGVDRSSRVERLATTTEDWTIEVTGPGGATGTYRLHVE